MLKWTFFALVCALLLGRVGHLYFTQESIIFRGRPLPKDTPYPYQSPFEELFFETDDGGKINALHFKTEKPKGVVLYLHGRGGNLLHPWGGLASDFTSRGYDCLIMDYRSFGKSTGHLSEKALLQDASFCYSYLKTLYPENQIVIYGRSLGTGIATYVAAQSNAKMLLLESPYFSFFDLVAYKRRYLPRRMISLLLKYPLRTNQWITQVRCPIYIFHSVQDRVIPYAQSIRLLTLLRSKRDAHLISIERAEHQSLSDHPSYQSNLNTILH